MLTSKQRAELRAQASSLDTILIVGKNGLSENLISQAEMALSARELIKGRVLENSLLSAREALDELCQALGAEPVQTVGSRFVLYRRNEKLHQNPQKPKKKNPVRAGAQARRKAAKLERERRNEYFRQSAIQKAAEKRNRGD